MEYRRFGSTDLSLSVIGFGAWGIGGPAMVGNTPIGWGEVDDEVSKRALRSAKELGINFFDTADFYGLGHSEKLIGEVFGHDSDIVIATKVGHRATPEGTIALDYRKEHIVAACEESLKRLKRETIDLYQLHSAKVSHLQQGECVEAMEKLKKQGKIRYWGISLNTFNPFTEAEWMMEHGTGQGFQLVFNIINQRAAELIAKAFAAGYGIIARMPLQFGLLTGAVTPETTFAQNDHRSFRLSKEIIESSLKGLEQVWRIASHLGISKTTLALSFCASTPGISTIIPGIKTPQQAEMNSTTIRLHADDMAVINDAYSTQLTNVMTLMEKRG